VAPDPWGFLKIFPFFSDLLLPCKFWNLMAEERSWKFLNLKKLNQLTDNRSVGGTLPWLARPLGTASPSTCGLHHCPEIHLRKNSKLIYLAASTPEVFPNWALYKLTYSFIHIQSAVASSHDRMWDLWNIWFQAVCTGQCAVVYLSTTDSTELSPSP